MLDTLYKTDNAKCSQLLLKYRNGRLESIVCGIRHVSAMTVYGVTAGTAKNTLPQFQANLAHE